MWVRMGNITEYEADHKRLLYKNMHPYDNPTALI
jgi:hypothetical protein